MSVQLPYLASPASVASALQKIKAASTPEKFTQDFVKTKLQIKGGTGNALVPFFKKIGFVNSDGSPSPLYKAFRNTAESGRAIFEALKIGYKPLYEVNEYAHELPDKELKGTILQLTGLEEDSRVVVLTLGTFKNLKQFASFEGEAIEKGQSTEERVAAIPSEGTSKSKTLPYGPGLNLSYTINLNLPATSDISVFNAIFKSLKENLLKNED